VLATGLAVNGAGYGSPRRLQAIHSRKSFRIDVEDGRKERERRSAERDKMPARPLRPDATDSADSEPHHALSNPAEEPDPTEYPDPYDRRPDPRDPEAVDTPALPSDPEKEELEEHAPRAPSTSEPPPPRNYDEIKPEKGE
jgi:hypothetical protein